MINQPAPKRLVKVLLEADLVRRMDRQILASAGAYQDRGEFITEAITDRLTEEEALMEQDAVVTPKVTQAADSSAVAEKPQFVPLVVPPLDASVEMGTWRNNGIPPTVPVQPTDRVNFGLHNRDLPTLWALDRLAVLAGQLHQPVAWEDFVARLRDEGAHAGTLLRHRDLASASSLGTGIGFPKPGAKRDASIDRFIAAAVGNNRRADGPFFVLALAGFTNDGHTHLAPSDQAIKVLTDMLERGLGPALPQPPAALMCWWQFIAALAPAEHAAWRKVLQVVADEPTRDELVVRFPEWPGNVATTNTVGFISRSREWGLVEPDLIDQRYRLTELGATMAREE
jgi:Arc/MetJ-type ribon-helix-helix transcriptional regulator